MDCRIVIKTIENGETTFSDLTKEVAEGIIANNNGGSITKEDILLYDLGNATGLEKQQKIIDFIESKKLTQSYAVDIDDDTEYIDKELESWRVSSRSQIVAKGGSTEPFDRQHWEDGIRQSYKDLVSGMPDLTLEQVEKIVEKSFKQAMEFNDKRAKLGTDAHKIAEIIFSNPSLVYKQEVLDEIERLVKANEIEFKTDFYIENKGGKNKTSGGIRSETVQYFLDLRRHLYSIYGPKTKFLTERSFELNDLNTDATYGSMTSRLCGTIDLIVIDENGEVHLYDFKSSTHDYNKWPPFKKRITAIQLYTYKKMLESFKGFRVKSLHSVALTFEIESERYDQKDSIFPYEYKGIKKFNTDRIWEHVNNMDGVIEDRVKNNISIWFKDQYIPPKPTEYMETEKLMNEAFIVSDYDSELSDVVAPYFTKNSKGEWEPNKEQLSQFYFYEFPESHPMRKRGYRYSFKMYGDGVATLCTDINDLKTKLESAINDFSAKGLDNAVQLAYTFAEEYKAANGQPDKINYNNLVKGNAEQQAIIRNEISHYLESGEFELNTDETYLNQGYLLWKHKTLGFVECVILSGSQLMETKRLAKGTTLLGKLYDDGHVDKKEIMTASNGNLAMMQFVAFLANSEGTKDWCSKMIDKDGQTKTCKIASIRVINPSGIGAKEIRPNLSFIVDNYTTLCDNSKNLLKDKEFKRIDGNLFYNDPQSLALQAVSQCEGLRPIYDKFDTTNFSFDYQKVDTVLEFIDECLTELVGPKQAKYQDLANFDPGDPTWRAIFYLINIRNSLHGHTYIAELGSGKWFNEGLSPTGLMISAPGMSTSTTLRTFDEINKAYVDSVIQDVNKYGKAGKDAVITMYKKLGMDKLLGGPSNGSTYLEMFEQDEYGGLRQDFQLRLPDDEQLKDEYKDVVKEFMLLNYRLTMLAQKSKKALDEFTPELKEKIWKDPQWARVPLMDAAFSRQLYNHHKAGNNWLQTIKYACVNKWREMGNLYNDVMVDDLKEFQDRADIYLKRSYTLDKRCTWNSFNYTSSPNKRHNLLTTYGAARFETNLEIVMDNMLVAFFKEYHSKQYASQLSALRLELVYAQRAGHDTTDILDVFDMAVRTKFYGESPIPKELQNIFRPLARLKGIFSVLQIGGKAVSMMKELVYGTFIGFSNTWGKTLPGLDAATYWKAFWYVLSHGHKNMKNVGKLNHLQMQYHISNYGLSQIADQRRYNFLGWRNWGTDTLFLTATSPDFFHRMIVLVGKMMADGTWDAYNFEEGGIDGNGELTYDVMKDPRFEKFTKNKYKDPEYWEQKALFERYVQEFNNAGFTDEEGNKLSVTAKNGVYYLPRPYLQKEVDTFKNYADMLYGHYDDESKALINDTFLGAFWLQYKTFVTAKIERYGMKPGVYNTHLLKQQYVTDEDGNKEALYLKIVKEGNELHRYVVPESKLSPRDIELRELGTAGDPNTGESVTAYIKWEGIPMEGIMQSMGSLSRTLMRVIKGDKEALGEFKLMWEDPTKRSNLLVALNDLILMGLLGMVGSTLFGMHNDLDFSEAWNNESAVRQLVRAGNWAENGLYDIFVGAMQDGPITNTISSMFQAPPIMTSIERAWKDSVDLITGDSSAFEFLTSEVGALRIFDGMAQAATAE